MPTLAWACRKVESAVLSEQCHAQTRVGMAPAVEGTRNRNAEEDNC
jgi:hypothetical protein